MTNKQVFLLITLAAMAVIVFFSFRDDPVDPADVVARQPPPIQSPGTADESAPQTTTLVSARPIVVPADGYLGSASCKKCHEDYYQSWHASYHRTMTQPITPATAPAAIENTTVEVEAQTYRFRRDNDDYLVELNDPIASGKRRERRLVMMTGSHHMHVFWYESGIEKTPAQLPILFLIDQQRWIPRRSAFLRSPEMEKGHELGRWNQTCCQCHATHPRQRPDHEQFTWDTHVADFGIACEACHGPGEGHVLYHERDGRADLVDDIVHPLELPADSRSDVCGQCHSIMMLNDDVRGIDEFLAHGRTFRPGDVLDEAHFHQVVRGSKEHWNSETFRRFNEIPGLLHGHFWPDGQVRISGRDYNGMIESACYKRGDLTCMSCHTMHQQDLTLQQSWKDDQLKPDMRGDAACLQCHSDYADRITEHTHHAADSPGSRCMNCHMPHTVYGVLKTIRSHTISSPSVASTIETGRPNACSLCHLDHTLEQTSNQLAEWYGHPKPRLTKEEKNTAASLLHLLQGDAAQRVLQVNAFQWQPACEISGTDWMRLYLLVGMDDPYEAIRLICERGYKSLPGVPTLDFDFLAPVEERSTLLGNEYLKIQREAALKPNPALLIDENGRLDQSRFDALIRNRNHRDVYLQE